MKSFVNIKTLYGVLDSSILRLSGKQMSHVQTLSNAYINVNNGLIVEYGDMSSFVTNDSEIIDFTGYSVLPCFCDSHTHIVFAEPRERELEMKIKGKSYEDIAASGGGILNSALKLNEMTEENLFLKSKKRLDSLIRLGTGAIEIKSGYGLTIESEIKILNVINRLKNEFNIPIKSTFLGAHAIPKLYSSDVKSYLSEVILPCLDLAIKNNLIDFLDIFIEKNYFSIKDAIQILDYAKKYNLKSKLHVNQLSNTGALQLGVDYEALSVDHLEEVSQLEIDYLKNKNTIATLLPSCSFFIKIPYAPARKMIDNGLSLALASDYNPGSTPSGNMNFVISLACLYQNLLPTEAFNAATINGAYAMDLSKIVGSISIGKNANFFISKEINSLSSIPYSFGNSLVEKVYINGELYF